MNDLRFATPQALCAFVESQISKELCRCERYMTPQQWRDHREWVEAYLREGAHEWAKDQAKRGLL